MPWFLRSCSHRRPVPLGCAGIFLAKICSNIQLIMMDYNPFIIPIESSEIYLYKTPKSIPVLKSCNLHAHEQLLAKPKLQ